MVVGLDPLVDARCGDPEVEAGLQVPVVKGGCGTTMEDVDP